MERYNRGAGAASAPSAPAAPANPYFTEGNPSLGVPATQPGPWWFHMVSEEMRKVITDAGLTPDHTDLTQLSAAIQAMIASAQINESTGKVIWTTGNAAPAGFIKANGALLSRATYADLWVFAQASGNIAANDGAWTAGQYSPGDGTTTFRIPDLRGEFIRCWDDGRGVDSGRVIGSAQAADIAPHAHSMPWREAGTRYGGATSSFNAIEASGGGSTNDSTGTETRPRNIAFLACIKY